MVGKDYVSMGNNSIKNSRIKILKPHAHLHIIETKFQMNPMKDVRVAETKSWLAKFVSMGDNSVKNSRIKSQKPYAHLHIKVRKSTKFQVNSMKDVGGVAETRSIERPDGQTELRTHGRTSVISISPPPTSGTKMLAHEIS